MKKMNNFTKQKDINTHKFEDSLLGGLPATKLRKKFDEIRTSTNNNHPKVTEPENIGTNHLRFAKSLFQQYSQQLGLNNNYYLAEFTFNFYVNKKITDCLGRTVDIKSARENFYTELFQHTSLPKNYSFTPIIKEINQIIEKYTQQQFPITYADKEKGRLQTPTATPKEIQLLTLKKIKVESPTNPLYHYIPKSIINILSTGIKQKKTELLGTYGNYFEEFKSQSTTLLEYQSSPSPPNFGTEFTYQNLISENQDIKTPNFQTQQNPNLENLKIETLNFQTPQNPNNTNPKTINQQNLPPVIVINQLPIELIIEPI
ncbi:hypothetical protein G9A89_018894 [Geosiphon pyriformis]|nr:hypothetical protein G9A89_018894 [Geosiphon pyriformis]